MKRSGFKNPGKPLTRKSSLKAKAPMARGSTLKRASKPKTSMAEKRHMGRVAGLGCILCQHLGYGATPAEVHHPRLDVGGGQRSSHFDTIPLCFPHHRGKNGVHDLGHDEFTAFHGISERELMAKVKELLGLIP